MEEFIFYLIGLSTCVFAFLTVTSRSIFHSAIWLALALLSVAGIYFYLGAQFLGVIQVLVYIGGIMTLFVFAIKLTANMDDQSIPQINKQSIVAGMVSTALFATLLIAVFSSPPIASNTVLESEMISLKSLGEALLTTYLLPFEFISLLLLAAMVGAIVIGKVKK